MVRFVGRGPVVVDPLMRKRKREHAQFNCNKTTVASVLAVARFADHGSAAGIATERRTTLGTL